jgi:solute carrier family 30 (zinc transporter), member 1
VQRYHQIARAIRDCLHAYGIHSSTIQPEFTDSALTPTEEVVLDDEVDEEDAALLGDGAKACMFECGTGGCADNRCCGPDTGNSNSNANQGTGSTS